MEDKQQLYTTFTKFVTLLGTLNGLSLPVIRKIIEENFNMHPFASQSIPEVKKLEKVEEDIKFLFNECIRICDELGPSREYFTILTLLTNITHDIIENDEAKAKELSKDILEKFEHEIEIINQKIPQPPLYNILLESRSLIEWSSIYCFYPFIPKRIKGEGRPVLLIPPYLGDDYSTSFVRRYLTSLGFKTYKWEQGFNMIKSHYIPRLEEKLFDIYQEHGQKVNLVGWSGGGIFAKIMANRHPDQVEQIVTIGSPVWGVMDMKTPVSGILEFFRGKSLKERNKRFIEELEPIPNVPITCIYTKTDGLLPWKHCMEAETYRDDIKNIEVYGSHSGLGANVSVLMITANALSANINGMTIKDTTSNIERILYPFYWNKKRRSLFFLN
ncbi:MAG: alpha/beta hydrolase [Bacteroidota bacterium]